MTAVTVSKRVPSYVPSIEAVVVTATDGYTFTSEKFKTVDAVQATLMEDTDSLSIPLSCAISDNVVTIHCTGLSAKKVSLMLMGRLG
jgi:hypothetical protein